MVFKEFPLRSSHYSWKEMYYYEFMFKSRPSSDPSGFYLYRLRQLDRDYPYDEDIKEISLSDIGKIVLSELKRLIKRIKK